MDETFAIVPRSITGSKKLTANHKVILTYMIEKYQAKDKEGHAWRFSVANIANETNIHRRTVERSVAYFCNADILKEAGSVRYGDNRPTTLYEFNFKAMKTYLGLNDIVITRNPAKNGEVEKVEEGLNDRLNDRLNDKSDKYKEDNTNKTLHSVTEGQCQNCIFKPMEEKAYVVSRSIPDQHSWDRTLSLVEDLNSAFGSNFIVEDGAHGTELFGHKVMAYDSDQCLALVIADHPQWATQPHFQNLCNEFHNKQWKILLYVSDVGRVFPMKRIVCQKQ